MPAHPIPVYIPVSIDSCLVDEEFDIFDITPPRKQRHDIGPLTLVCDNSWDDRDDDD